MRVQSDFKQDGVQQAGERFCRRTSHDVMRAGRRLRLPHTFQGSGLERASEGRNVFLSALKPSRLNLAGTLHRTEHSSIFFSKAARACRSSANQKRAASPATNEWKVTFRRQHAAKLLRVSQSEASCFFYKEGREGIFAGSSCRQVVACTDTFFSPTDNALSALPSSGLAA